MGIFGRKTIKKVPNRRDFKPPVDVHEIDLPETTLPEINAFGEPRFDDMASLESMDDFGKPRFPPASQPAAQSNYPQNYQQQNYSPAPQQTPQPGTKDEKAAFAPLFVKLTRYRQILNSMNYLKTSLSLVKNQLAILNELERLKAENMKLLQSTLDKVNDKIAKLDSEFMRPSGFMEDAPEAQMGEIESLEATINDLKVQIDGLKHDINTIA